jgi:Tfp pilus assembly protein FimT
MSLVQWRVWQREGEGQTTVLVKPTQNQRHRAGDRGFSLLEMVIVVGMLVTVMSMALLAASSLGPSIRSNAALNTVLAQMRTAREQAIAQRRNIRVEFLGNNQIRLTRSDLPTGTTVLSTITLNASVQFNLFSGLPDTPETFGNSSAVSFGGTPVMTFLSDGTFVDAAGQPLNGTVFLGIPNDQATARAVTILGATGRVHAYRWNGSAWAQ